MSYNIEDIGIIKLTVGVRRRSLEKAQRLSGGRSCISRKRYYLANFLPQSVVISNKILNFTAEIMCKPPQPLHIIQNSQRKNHITESHPLICDSETL